MDRKLAESMLRAADADVQKHYYDSKLHSVDWKAHMEEARRNIETAPSVDDAVSEIAELLDSLHDSHTFLVLPPRRQLHDHGFQMEMIGDRCYVVRVRTGSDAEKKGLRQGDEIRAVNNYPVSEPCSGYVNAQHHFLPGLRAKPQRYIIQLNEGLIQVIRPMLNGETNVPASSAAFAISGRYAW